MARGGRAGAAAQAQGRRLGRPARVRHRVAAHAVRRRLRGDQLAEGVRRPRRHAHRAPHLHRGDRAGAGALRGLQLRGPAPRRAHADRRRVTGAEGRPPARHPQGRAGLVSGLLRAERGLRPRQPADPRRARRRRVRAQRPEDLDQLRPCRRVLRDARAHEPRPRGAQAGRDHLADRAHGRRRHRHPPAAGDGGHHRVLRGLPRRRARAGRSTGSATRTTAGASPTSPSASSAAPRSSPT